MVTPTCHGLFSLLALCHAVVYLFASTFARGGLQLEYAILFVLLWSNSVMSLNLPDILGCGVMQLISRLWTAILSLNPRRRSPYLGVTIHSLAFGGRGYFASASSRPGGRVFDSTLGFPGEGPTKQNKDSGRPPNEKVCANTIK